MSKIIRYSQLKVHKNFSAKFWEEHDEKNCKECQEALKNGN